MTTSSFGGVSYPTERQMLDAVAETWITGDGEYSEDSDIRDMLADFGDEELAAQVLDYWDGPWTLADLTAAFARFRDEYDVSPEEKAQQQRSLGA